MRSASIARVLFGLLLDLLSPGSTCWTHRARIAWVPLASHPAQLSLDLACRAYRVRVARVLLVLLLDHLSPGSTCWTHRAKAVRVRLCLTVGSDAGRAIVLR